MQCPPHSPSAPQTDCPSARRFSDHPDWQPPTPDACTGSPAPASHRRPQQPDCPIDIPPPHPNQAARPPPSILLYNIFHTPSARPCRASATLRVLRGHSGGVSSAACALPSACRGHSDRARPRS
ncbi:hypothetical protein DAEQUDRAFT_722770 [Daedalea quercina L-15889]|uniref:Uncharacterized protein n=1 Tax=Daedalea quercina L-15889 TaxID=1314783 RepID=A0A165SWZ2_9APHY|nr:hypothetical protein DAEQUDRAFT_722770 [Daedalea quercina L-15889]